MAQANHRRVSVFTPTYNRCHTLARLYESLCTQGDADLEWLIIDDGSTDDTRAWVAGVAAAGVVPIRYHYQENAGKQAAWNRAVDLAAAPYFMCVDSDDAIARGMLVQALALCDRVLPVDESVIGVRFASMKDDSRAEMSGQALFEGKHSYFDELASRQFEERMDVLKTDVLKEFKYPVRPTVRFIPEIWFYVNAAARGYFFHYSKLPLGNYYSDHRQLSRTRLSTHARGHFISRSAMLRHCPPVVWRDNPLLLAKTMIRWAQAGTLTLWQTASR